MQFLRANTQVIVTVGPFVDVGDGFTPQTDITLAGNEAELIKHGSTTVVDISGATWAAVADCRGYYSLTLTAGHTDTEGMLVVIVQDDSDCLPVKQEYMVLSEAAYDSLCVAKDDGYLDVNIKTVGRADTQETEANNLEAACAAYSATRGLAGTALPAAVADAPGGLPISDAGELDLDTLLGRLDAAISSRAAAVTALSTATWTAARAAVLSDLIDGGRLDLLIDAIKVITDALTAAGAAKLALAAAGIVSGVAEAGTLSTTQMTTDLTEATDDHYIGAVIVWTSGVLAGQRSDVTDYAGANGLLTFTAVTEAPSAADTFVIL